MPLDDSLLPRRNSLVGECVRVMKARIAAGEWAEHLPGERRLAALLNVGRDTIRLTLGELTAEGLIAGGESGRHRRLTGGREGRDIRHRENWRIGMRPPLRLATMSPPGLAAWDQGGTLLAHRGGVLQLLSPPWYDAPQPQRKLLHLLAAEPQDAWILYRSSREIQAAFQASRTPCVIRGYPHQGIDLPHMDCDWTATGRHAVGELWRKGHRRIGVLMPRDGLRGNTAAWQGAVSFHEENVVLLEIRDDGTNAGLTSAVSAAIGHAEAPTAFITLRPRQTITLLTWLGSQGFRVPRDFSLISLATESFMAHCVPAMTAYRLDPLVFAKRVVRHLELLVGGQLGSQGSLLLMPEMVPGVSVAAR